MARPRMYICFLSDFGRLFAIRKVSNFGLNSIGPGGPQGCVMKCRLMDQNDFSLSGTPLRRAIDAFELFSLKAQKKRVRRTLGELLKFLNFDTKPRPHQQ
jgi:hypothetical protein